MIGTWRQMQAQQNMLDHLTAEPQGRSEEEVISDAAKAAVEVATIVKIDNDLIEAFEKASGRSVGRDSLAGLKAIFEAAGFEVVE